MEVSSSKEKDIKDLIREKGSIIQDQGTSFLLKENGKLNFIFFYMTLEDPITPHQESPS